MARLVVIAFAFTACEKVISDATETTDSAEDMASDMVAVSSLTDALQDIVSSDPNLQMKNGNPFISREYFSYKNDDSVFTDGDGIVILFEFEDPDNPNYPYLSIFDNPAAGTGSKGGDGATRWGSGRIRMDLPYSDPNCTINLELDRYIILKEGTLYLIDDGNKKLGGSGSYECIISRTGADAWDIDYNFSFVKRKLTESYVGGKTYNVGTFHVATIDGGSEGLLDDQMMVTGTAANCKNRQGTVYSFTVTDTLRRVLTPGCSNTFVKGKMELKNNGSKFTLKADFGDGTCDNDVNVELPGGVKKTITIK
ncbi:MAG: hypothetical protein GC180_06815 [Bacteroidetes bacterium]|nr:hypothetical protein [Bacteroidota bacterium]